MKISSLQKGLVLDLPLNLERYNPGTLEHTDLTPYENRGLNNGAVVGALSSAFNGSSDYVDCGKKDSLNITGDISLSVWIRTNTITGGYDAIIHKGVPGPNRYALFLNNGEVNGTLTSGTSVISINSGVTVGKWVNAIWTFSDTLDESKIYINGIFNNSAVETSTIGSTTTKDLHIGNTETYGNPFNGDIAKARIYNRALSPSEVELYYDQTKHLFL